MAEKKKAFRVVVTGDNGKVVAEHETNQCFMVIKEDKGLGVSVLSNAELFDTLGFYVGVKEAAQKLSLDKMFSEGLGGVNG